jgi:ComF family protein
MPIHTSLLRTLHHAEILLSHIIFPAHCLCCEKSSPGYLCQACIKHIPLKIQQQCPFCQKVITTSGQLCPNCFGKTALDGIYSATSFQDPLVKKLIHTFKYRYIQSLAPILAKIILRSLTSNELPLPDMLMPVPLHARRYRMRGFNQAQLLAEHLSTHITPGMPLPCMDTVLRRTRYTSSQAKIPNRKNRLKNLQDAFKALDKTQVKNKNIWLIDDVSTTGGTLFACAETLKKAGAKSVYGIVVAS